MDWHIIADRLLGFLPQRLVFWLALGTASLTYFVQKASKWADEVTASQWRKKENQNKRQELIKIIQEKGKS